MVFFFYKFMGGTMMHITIFYFCVSFLLTNSIRWFYRIYRSNLYIANTQKKTISSELLISNDSYICVILPVLEETTRIENTIIQLQNYCNDIQNLYIVCVTTEKEYTYHKKTNSQLINAIENMKDVTAIREFVNEKVGYVNPVIEHENNLNKLKEKARKAVERRSNTIELLSKINQKYNNIIVYHYSGEGVMAHQVNFGVHSFIKEYPEAEDKVLFALYNADSEISKSILEWILHVKDMNDQPVIFQQYGNYTKNFDVILKRKLFSKGILLASSMWQCRWSYAFELFNCLNQYRQYDPFSYGLRVKRERDCFNYCIGHGLYFDYKTFLLFGGFSEKTHNEDQIFGLQASLYSIPIIPVPIFEKADSPTSVRSLVIQKKTWFWGPFDAFKYRKILSNTIAEKVNKYRLLYFTLRLFEHALRWLIVPIITLGMIIFSIINAEYMPILLILIMLYLGGINYLCFIKMNAVPKLKWHQAVLAIILSPIQFLLHGYSGLCTFIKSIIYQLINKKIEKVKTPI
jgi:hypothetical protein